MIKSPLFQKFEAFCKKDFETECLMTRFDIPIKLESPSNSVGEAKDYMNVDISVVSEKLLDPVFGGHSANPNRQITIDRLNSVFEGNSYKRGTSEISFEEVKAEILELMTSKGHVAIVGERGSGKTLLVNKILNDETKSWLEDVKKTAWFRIDVTKIYDLLKDERSDKAKISFRNYFKIHTAYVFLEYSDLIHNPHSDKHGISQFFKTVMEKSVEEGESSFCNKFIDHIDTILNFYGKFSNHVGSLDNYPSETVISLMFQSGYSEIMDAFIGVYDCFLHSISKLNYGITAIIDGIDNVSWSKDNRDYIKVTSDARQFIREFSDIVPIKKSTLLLVCRPETVPELKTEFQSYNRGPYQKHKDDTVVESWNMVVPCAVSVIQKKLEAARNAAPFESQRLNTLMTLKEKREISESDSTIALEAVLNDYEKNSGTILDQFVEQVNLILSSVRLDNLGLFQRRIETETFLEDVFSNNLRALIHGFRRSKEGRQLQEKQGARGTALPSRVPEFLLIGGKLYLDSSPRRSDMRRYTEIEMGDVFPNLFWYNPNWAVGHGNVWHGLTGVRLLQIFNQTRLPAGDCLYLLHKIFDYSVDILCEQLEAFVAYGLLDMNLQEAPHDPVYCPNDPKYSKLYEYDSFVKVTKKGKIHSTLSFFYVDYLYFCALDTPLHSKFLSSVSGDRYVRFYIEPLIEKHSTKGARRRRYDFNQARIPTTCVFLRHIYHYHRTEMKFGVLKHSPDPEIDKIVEKEFARGEMTNADALRHFFALPDGWLENALLALGGAYLNMDKPKTKGAFRELTQAMDDNFGFSE